MVGNLDQEFEGGTKGFLFKGTNGRWRDVLTDEELVRYERRVSETMSVEAARSVPRPLAVTHKRCQGMYLVSGGRENAQNAKHVTKSG